MFRKQDYHPKWTLIVRLIAKRSGNKCEGSYHFPDCEAKNGAIHPETGSKVVLSVAHLDCDRSNNRFWNLMHWCQRCHLRWDLGHHLMNRKYGRYYTRIQYKIPFKDPVSLLHPFVRERYLKHDKKQINGQFSIKEVQND